MKSVQTIGQIKRWPVLQIKTKELLIFYFTGELDKKIQRYEKKSFKKWPESYYCTLDSVKYHYMKSNTNNIGDPTGHRAAELADLSLNNIDLYYTYLVARKVFKAIMRSLTVKEINQLKKHLMNNRYRRTYNDVKRVINKASREIRKKKATEKQYKAIRRF